MTHRIGVPAGHSFNGKIIYSEDEEITIATLDKLLDLPDMLTVVIIGNQSTGNHADWMITPRGYLGFNQ